MDDVLPGGAGQDEARQSCGNRAKYGDAVGLQVERPGETDRCDDDQERRREPRHDAAEYEENRKRDRAEDDRRRR